MRTTKLSDKLHFKCILLDSMSKYSTILFMSECNVRLYYTTNKFKFAKFYENI